jgi:hypothetical protein
MCKLELLYTADELKTLDAKSKQTLLKHGMSLVQKAPEIRNIVAKDPKVRKKLKSMMRSKFNQLKRK